MDYSDEQLEDFRKKAIGLKERMGLLSNPPIKDRSFTLTERKYLLACNEQGIPYKISARIINVENPEKVQSYIHSRSRKPRNYKSPKQTPSSNGNPPSLSASLEEGDEPESLEGRVHLYFEDDRTDDLIKTIRNYEALGTISNLWDVNGYRAIIVLYGNPKELGIEERKAFSILSTKANDLVRKVEKIAKSRAFPSNVDLYENLKQMSSYARQELERFSPKKF